MMAEQRYHLYQNYVYNESTALTRDVSTDLRRVEPARIRVKRATFTQREREDHL